MFRAMLTALVVSMPIPAATHAQAWSERDYQQVLCAGMETEVLLPDGGGRADCSDGKHIIEIDWADKFKEGVGQILTYSVKSDLIPGLILICRRSGASCLQHALIAEETLSGFGAEAVIWRCSVEARSLADCLEMRLPVKP